MQRKAHINLSSDDSGQINLADVYANTYMITFVDGYINDFLDEYRDEQEGLAYWTIVKHCKRPNNYNSAHRKVPLYFVVRWFRVERGESYPPHLSHTHTHTHTLELAQLVSLDGWK